MADYYSLLSRAVSNLPKTGSASSRKAVYDRARSALVAQLRSLQPPLPEADITREQSALDNAAAKLEAEIAATAASAAAAQAARPAPAAKPAQPSSSPPRGAQPAPTKPASVSQPPKASAATGVATATKPAAAAANVRPPPAPGPAPATRPAVAASGGAAAPKPAAAVVGARPVVAPRSQEATAAKTAAAVRPAAPSIRPAAPAAAPPIAPALVPADEAEAAAAPSLDRAIVVSEDDDDQRAPPLKAAGDVSRPPAPTRDEEPPRRILPWLLLAMLVGLAGAIAVAAFVWRQSELDFTRPIASGPSPTPVPSADKIEARAGGEAATETPTPTSTPTPEPSASASPAPTPTPAPSTATPKSTATPVATASPSPTASASSDTAAPAPVGARAAVLIGVSPDPQVPPAVHLGSVVWSSSPAVNGQSSSVKAEADVPDLKFHAIVVMRKNLDPTIPATHVIDIRFTVDGSSELKGIKDMVVPMMHMDDGQQLDPLAGADVKVGDGHFLVGLDNKNADLAHNLDLLGSHTWFDFPVVLIDDRPAKLTIEKGADGEKIVAQALAAWK